METTKNGDRVRRICGALLNQPLTTGFVDSREGLRAQNPNRG